MATEGEIEGRLILKRQPDTRPEEQFWYVQNERGKVVGRIFRDTPGKSTGLTEWWFWGLLHPYERGSGERHYGNKPTREEAMAAFKARWQISK